MLFRARFDEALSKLGWWKVSLPMARGWNWVIFKVSSNLGYSMINYRGFEKIPSHTVEFWKEFLLFCPFPNYILRMLCSSLPPFPSVGIFLLSTFLSIVALRKL